MHDNLYVYEGPLYNGNVLYKSIKEYVHADTEAQAIVFLKRRLKYKYTEISFVKLIDTRIKLVRSDE